MQRIRLHTKGHARWAGVQMIVVVGEYVVTQKEYIIRERKMAKSMKYKVISWDNSICPNI